MKILIILPSLFYFHNLKGKDILFALAVLETAVRTMDLGELFAGRGPMFLQKKIQTNLIDYIKNCIKIVSTEN